MDSNSKKTTVRKSLPSVALGMVGISMIVNTSLAQSISLAMDTPKEIGNPSMAYMPPAEPVKPAKDPKKDVAPVYYVSPFGNNGDGKSWKEAWKDCKKIDWNKVTPGSTIVFDGGGAAGMEYGQALEIPKVGTEEKPIEIVASNEPGKNGEVRMKGKDPYGILIGDGASVTINGLRKDLTQPHINIQGFAQAGILIAPGAKKVNLIGLEIAYNGLNSPTGRGVAILGGDKVRLLNCMVHDNQLRNIEVHQDLSPGKHHCLIDRSWVFASKYNPKKENRRNGGVDTFTDASNTVRVEQCILGPALDDAFNLYDGKGKAPKENVVHTEDVLFINADVSNISQYTRFAEFENVTSYMSTFNFFRKGHIALFTADPKEGGLKNSIVYDGTCFKGSDIDRDLKDNKVTFQGQGNIQSRVTGNTTLISKKMADPNKVFVQGYFANTTYALSPDSYRFFDFTALKTPEVGVRSVVSISRLLQFKLDPTKLP